jgi:hypothetical protein
VPHQEIWYGWGLTGGGTKALHWLPAQGIFDLPPLGILTRLASRRPDHRLLVELCRAKPSGTGLGFRAWGLVPGANLQTVLVRPGSLCPCQLRQLVSVTNKRRQTPLSHTNLAKKLARATDFLRPTSTPVARKFVPLLAHFAKFGCNNGSRRV